MKHTIYYVLLEFSLSLYYLNRIQLTYLRTWISVMSRQTNARRIYSSLIPDFTFSTTKSFMKNIRNVHCIACLELLSSPVNRQNAYRATDREKRNAVQHAV